MIVVTLTMNQGNVVCLLCDAIINIKTGNYYKLQLHMENDHDIFKHQDLIMSLCFLEQGEMEVVIEKVLPRMKSALDLAVTMSQKKMLNGEFAMHRRLSNYEIQHDLELEEHDQPVNDKHDEKKDEKLKLNSDGTVTVYEENDAHDHTDLENDIEMAPLTYEPEVKKPVVKVKRIKERIVSEIKEVRKKPVVKPAPQEQQCPICFKMIKKYKINLHKRNCKILQKLNLKKKQPQEEVSEYSYKLNEIENDLKSIQENIKDDRVDCNYCDKKFKLKKYLKAHEKNFHTSLT